MKRKGKIILTKDGYEVKKHTITLNKDRYYTISKNGSNRGWYTYKELFNALAILRTLE